ncbi:MAG: phosphate-starvation-inducible PsiE family protein, partial [Deltaproteobacteria bacterium]|nr:phosphate-starvation-inducible PsiE family protein [Deltaproteobacteria bacterium]
MKSAADQPQHAAARHVYQTVVPMLETADAVVYAMVGVVFFVAALGMLGYSVIAFPTNLHDTGFGLAIVKLINDLLLVMIIMEVLRTVLSYLQEGGSSLQPFLFIAAISATRRILAVGAQMSVAGENITPDRFQKAMLDLGANAGAILAISVALYLLQRHPASDD